MHEEDVSGTPEQRLCRRQQ